MPTSSCPETPASGFTLLELMVVLVILGLMSAVVMLALPAGAGQLRDTAEALAASGASAREQALFTSRATALRIDPDGFALETRESGRWRPEAKTAWPDGVTLWGAPARLAFDPTGVAEPQTIVLAQGEERIAVQLAVDGGILVQDAP